VKLSQFIHFRYKPTQPNFFWQLTDFLKFGSILGSHIFWQTFGGWPKFGRSRYLAVARNTNYTHDTTLVKAKWCRVCSLADLFTTFTLADYKDFVAVFVLPAIVFSQRGRANF